jgi:hypothetical protein
MEINADMITQWGMINKISTGHPTLDVLLCMLLPLLMKHLLPQLKQWVTDIMDILLKKEHVPEPEEVTRTVTFIEDPSGKKNKEQEYNDKLQEAILYKVNRTPNIAKILQQASAGLTQRDKAGPDTGRSSYFSDWNSDCSDDSEEWYEGKELEAYGVNLTPPDGADIKVTDRITFTRYVQHQAVGRKA